MLLVLLECITVKSLPLPSCWPSLNMASCFPLDVFSYLAWTSLVPSVCSSPLTTLRVFFVTVSVCQHPTKEFPRLEYSIPYVIWQTEEDNHFPWFCGCTAVNTAQEAVDFLWCQIIWLAHVQLSVNTPRCFQQSCYPAGQCLYYCKGSFLLIPRTLNLSLSSFMRLL